MVSITPQGDIYLCKTPLENDYKNQLTFSNATSQFNYFNSKVFRSFDNYTYIKHDNIIKVGLNIDEIIGCNYLFYRNEGFSNKWYYCFITNMEYVNENCTSITFETDVWQTYQFDLTYKQCFVEREHVNDDTVGLHTVPENLETGDYIIDKKTKKAGYDTTHICFILATTMYPYITQTDGKWYLNGGYANPCNVYNSNLSGLEYWWYTNTANGIERLQHTIQAFNNSGQGEGIYMIFTCPDNCFEKVLENQNEGFWGYVKQKQGSYNIAWGDVNTDEIYKATTLNGYTPRNKKLLTWPFCYILMNNGNGGNAIYKYELFKNSNNICYFTIDNAICPGASIFLTPAHYNLNDATFHDVMDGLPLGKFPMCSWNSDAYINWLTQNSANVKMSLLSSAFNIGANVMQQNPIGAVSSGIGAISNVLQIMNKRDTATPQAEGNTNSGDVIYSMSETTFTCYQMSIKEEYAQIIDKYFDMFGYKVNIVKLPNITGRTNWKYVKTIDCNIEGDIPQQHLQLLRQMFNNGVTLWHNASTMYDYSQSNNIVS